MQIAAATHSSSFLFLFQPLTDIATSRFPSPKEWKRKRWGWSCSRKSKKKAHVWVLHKSEYLMLLSAALCCAKLIEVYWNWLKVDDIISYETMETMAKRKRKRKLEVNVGKPTMLAQSRPRERWFMGQEAGLGDTHVYLLFYGFIFSCGSWQLQKCDLCGQISHDLQLRGR